jgi:hypothetical protein
MRVCFVALNMSGARPPFGGRSSFRGPSGPAAIMGGDMLGYREQFIWARGHTS